jgi:tRNA wybutosine-synthesizing protein 3
LHLLTSSLQDAQTVLSAASSAGFRESGAMSLSTNQDGSVTPMVAVRSTGLAFDTVIGYQNPGEEIISIVTEAHLKLMLDIAHERFKVNTERIQRFRTGLLSSQRTAKSANGRKTFGEWEDKDTRQARKREEGLIKQRILQQMKNEDENEQADSNFATLELP